MLATTAHSGASMSISHADADPDTDGYQVDLAVGVTVIRFSTLVSEDGAVSAKTYKLVVTRARSDPDNASLSELRISDVGLNPDFVAERTNYETSLVAEVTRLTVEAVPTAPGATVVITPTDADPDTPEHEIDLGRRDFKIRVKVTAPDETTSRTYQVQLFDDRLRLLSVGHVNIELDTHHDRIQHRGAGGGDGSRAELRKTKSGPPGRSVARTFHTVSATSAPASPDTRSRSRRE